MRNVREVLRLSLGEGLILLWPARHARTIFSLQGKDVGGPADFHAGPPTRYSGSEFRLGLAVLLLLIAINNGRARGGDVTKPAQVAHEPFLFALRGRSLCVSAFDKGKSPVRVRRKAMDLYEIAGLPKKQHRGRR